MCIRDRPRTVPGAYDAVNDARDLELLEDAVRLHQGGRHAEALARYDEFLARHPDHPQALNFAALAHFDRGDAAAARALLENACRFAPDYGEAQANLGLVARAQGDTATAREALELAVRLLPDDAETPLALSLIHI